MQTQTKPQPVQVSTKRGTRPTQAAQKVALDLQPFVADYVNAGLDFQVLVTETRSRTANPIEILITYRPVAGARRDTVCHTVPEAMRWIDRASFGC